MSLARFFSLRRRHHGIRSADRVVVWLLLTALLAPGCSRARWRQQADQKTYGILAEKSTDPRWTPPRYDLAPDPRSRFADVYDPDCPPLPPDDPEAHVYMHEAYGKKGYRKWHAKFGDTVTVENPHWLEPYGLDESVVNANFGRPALLPRFERLTLEDAVSLAYVHSRDYQSALESLYLASLQLTFQRFLFDVQFLGIGNRRPSSDNLYTVNPGGNPDQFQTTNRAGVSQLLPGGGQWAVELVNNTLWIFGAGNNSSSTTSVLSYSLIQPLLANGGRRYAMENLTQGERDVLYALRNFARYRMGFFTTVVCGGQQAGVSVGVPGVFTGSGPIPSPVSQGGYFGLMQQQQVILNQRANIRSLEERLARTKEQVSQKKEWESTALAVLPNDIVIPDAYADRLRYDAEQKLLYWKGVMAPLDRDALVVLSADPLFKDAIVGLYNTTNIEVINQTVAQLQTQLAQQLIQLANAERQLQDTFDSYKLVLGLPTDTFVALDDSLLEPFALFGPEIYSIQDELTAQVQTLAAINEEDPSQEEVRGFLAKLEASRDRIASELFPAVQFDVKRTEAILPKRLEAAESDEEREFMNRLRARDLSLLQTQNEDFRTINTLLADLKRLISADGAELADRKTVFGGLKDVREDLVKVTQGLQVVQIGLRLGMIELNDFDLELEEAIEIGLENRQDLMNIRAQVMDARRRMEVTANQLQAVLNVVVAGDIRTKPLSENNHNPFDFRADQSSIRAGVNFTAPVQLVQQRNAYRAAQIGYQQARRNYMRTEDQVKLDIRTAWRQLNVNRRNFDLSRAAVRAANIQLDIAVEQSTGPAAVGGGGNQGLNLLQALNSVLQTQNQLIQTWVVYETNRINIYNFMGTLELDPNGFWNDPFYQKRLRDAQEQGRGIEVPPAAPPVLPHPESAATGTPAVKQPRSGAVPASHLFPGFGASPVSGASHSAAEGPADGHSSHLPASAPNLPAIPDGARRRPSSGTRSPATKGEARPRDPLPLAKVGLRGSPRGDDARHSGWAGAGGVVPARGKAPRPAVTPE